MTASSHQRRTRRSMTFRCRAMSWVGGERRSDGNVCACRGHLTARVRIRRMGTSGPGNGACHNSPQTPSALSHPSTRHGLRAPLSPIGRRPHVTWFTNDTVGDAVETARQSAPPLLIDFLGSALPRMREAVRRHPRGRRRARVARARVRLPQAASPHAYGTARDVVTEQPNRALDITVTSSQGQ